MLHVSESRTSTSAQLERVAYRTILADALYSAAAAGLDVGELLAEAIDRVGLATLTCENRQRAVGCDRCRAVGAVGSAVG